MANHSWQLAQQAVLNRLTPEFAARAIQQLDQHMLMAYTHKLPNRPKWLPATGGSLFLTDYLAGWRPKAAELQVSCLPFLCAIEETRKAADLYALLCSLH